MASLVGIVTCVVALLAWRAGSPFTHQPRRFDHPMHQRVWWMGSRLGPAWQTENTRRAEIIFVGDSRVKSGLDLRLAESLGGHSLAKIWRAGARTADLLSPLLEWERPRTLVVSLTPLGFQGLPNKVVAETLRAPNPASDPAEAPWRVAQWAQAEQVHLVEQGFNSILAEKTMQWWIGEHQEMRTDYLATERFVNTPFVDQDLNAYVDMQRSLWLHPIEPSDWTRSWWREVNTDKSDVLYSDALSRKNRVVLEKGYKDLERVLRELIEKGWRVAALRMPIEPGLREIEDQSLAGGWPDQIVQDLGLPYMDLGAWPDSTLDGSHLNMVGAARATGEVALWLKQIWADVN